jgi:hypothetical protein
MVFASKPVARRGVDRRDDEEREAGHYENEIEHG